MLSHTRRLPCVELLRSEGGLRPPRPGCPPRRRRASGEPLRAYKVAESAPDYAAIDFGGRLRMAARLKEGRLRISFSRYDATANFFRLRLAAWPDERIFGCGDRAARSGRSLDLKGSRVTLWVEESGAIGDRGGFFGRQPLARSGSGAGASHFPLPVFISSKGYWCAADSPAFAVFDFRRKAVTVLEWWAVPREIVLGFGDQTPSIMADMTTVLGRQPQPPNWCYDGVCLGLSGGEAAAEESLAAAIAAGIEVAAVWLRDWCGPRAPGSGLPADWTRDESLYPNLPEMAARWRTRGIRCLGSIGPLLPAGGRLFAEASAAGILVKDSAGRAYALPTAGGEGGAALLDLSSADALSWMKGLISRELLGAGMSGWEADYGEQLPADAVLASGEEAVRAHNRWPVLWARVNREAVEESGKADEILCVARSGWLGAARQVPAFFAAERSGGFSPEDGLPSLVPAALALGLSGVGFWHSEAGGSEASSPRRRGPRSRECLRRWIELSAFTPLLRVAARPGPSPLDAETLALLARMSETFSTLKPYHVATAAEYGRAGLPALRHPWIHYGADPQAHRLTRQYLYGRDLMVAPVLEPALALTELYLPEDEWVHLWTSRAFRGGRVTIESPSGCPAVFYRASSEFAPLFDTLRRTVRRV